MSIFLKCNFLRDKIFTALVSYMQSLTKPDLLRQLQSRKERERRGGDGEGSGSNLAVLTTDNEEDQLSTGGSTEDITTRDRRRGGGGGGGGNTTGASSNEQTDDALLNLHVAASHGETTSDETETDSCIHSHSVTSTGSTFTTTDGLEEVGTLRRSLSLVRLNSEEFGVLEETDAAASTPVKDSKSEGTLMCFYASTWDKHTLTSIYSTLIRINCDV